jgi:hypothetical protein
MPDAESHHLHGHHRDVFIGIDGGRISGHHQAGLGLLRVDSVGDGSGSTDSRGPGGRSLTFTFHSTSYFIGTMRWELFGGRL